MRADPRHDEIGGKIEYDIADVEQRQTSGDLFGCDVEYRSQIMTFSQVHSLSKSDIGANRRAYEVKDPECWKYPAIELAGRLSA